jgi:hypothetical protein
MLKTITTNEEFFCALDEIEDLYKLDMTPDQEERYKSLLVQCEAYRGPTMPDNMEFV